MAGFDLSDVLAAARGIPGAREDGRWRCVVNLSAYDWMSGWLRVPDMAAQSAACKAWLSAHGDVRKAETIRNRNAVRNVRAAFDELMRVIENRRADCVVVPDIAVFAPCFSEARFYVEEVLMPMGFRFVDCARGFDTQGGDVRAYFKGLQTEMSDALALHAEHDRLASGGLIRRNVPFRLRLRRGRALRRARGRRGGGLRPQNLRACRPGALVAQQAGGPGARAWVPRAQAEGQRALRPQSARH